tara:strand:- start:753 stop:1184 length:432 start_codon:yes stop_codon:yes gene_type:complete
MTSTVGYTGWIPNPPEEGDFNITLVDPTGNTGWFTYAPDGTVIACFGTRYSPYKMVAYTVDGNVVNLKITNFPSVGTMKSTEYNNESMWVIVIEGDDYSGIGELQNQPHGEATVKLGDYIEYGEGTNDSKPVFIRKVKKTIAP